MTYDSLLFPMLVLAFVLALYNFTLQLRTIVPIEKFLKWAGRDITNEMPKGEWRSAEGD